MSFLTNRNGVSLSVSTNIALSSVPLSYRLAPSLLLDFTNTNTLDSRITFTRASTATFTGSNGLLQTAAINAPRFDYNPTTLASLGLLIEEQRANLVTYSDDFANAAWNAVVTVTLTGGVAAPSGTNNAFTATATGSNSVLGQFVTSSIGVYTASFWIRRRTGTGGIAISAGPNSPIPVTVDSTWRRVSVTNTATTTTIRAYLHIAVLGDAVDVFGAQLEAGAFPTSYIPTVASQVTRSADNASITGVNFSSWYNQSQGTLYANVLLQSAPSLGNAIAAISDSTNNNRIQLGASSAGGGNLNFLVSDSGVAQANPFVGSISSVGPHKLAGAFAANNFQVSANGLLGTQDSSGTVPTTVNAFQIGTTGNPNTKGNLWIYRLAYYPRRLANSELQALTS